MMIMNPDVILEPDGVLLEMVLKDPKVGLAEARQTPLEHAKEYDIKTGGETEGIDGMYCFQKQKF